MAQRKLEVVFLGDTSDFDRAVNKVDKGESGLSGSFGKIAKGAAIGGAALGGALVVGAMDCVKAFQESEKVTAQTNAVLKSTGGVAHLTAKEVGDLAQSISSKSGIDDEAIQSGENLLLTFTNIRNEAGKGNDVFDQTTRAAADMATAMGTDVKTAAMQLGKAINDPLKGMTKLQRVGVTFTDDQKAQVAAMVKSGDTMGAQKIILGELTKEFGGSAEAAGGTFAGKMNKAQNALENLEEIIGGFIVPILGKAADGFTKLIEEAQKIDFQKLIKGFSGSGGALKGLAGVQKDIGPLWKDLSHFAVTIAPEVQDAVKMLAKITGEKLKGMIESFRGVIEFVRGFVKVLDGIFSGDFSKVLDGVKMMFSGLWEAVKGGFRQATAPIRALAGGIINGVVGVFEDGVGAVKSAIGAITSSITTQLSAIFSPVKAIGSKIVELIGAGISAGSGLYSAILDKMKDVFSGIGNVVGDGFSKLKNVGEKIVEGVAKGIGAAGGIYGAILDKMKDVFSGIGSVVGDGFSKLKDVGGNVVEGIAKGIGAAGGLFSSIKEKMGDIISGVESFFGDGFSKAKDLGESVVKAIGRGIAGAANLARSAAHVFVKAIDDAIPNSFGFSTPLGKINVDIPNNPLHDITGLAGGTASFAGGLARVGELGPETVYLPKGSRVVQASQSDGGRPVHVEVNNYGNALDERQLADRLAWQLATA